MDDELLLRRVEQALANFNRAQGLSEELAEVLAAVRIRLFGAPVKTLDDVLQAAGELKGKVSLENLEEPSPEGSLDDAFSKPEEKKDWPSG